MENFEEMYYELMGKIADIEEFLMCADVKNPMVDDARVMVENIIERFDSDYIRHSDAVYSVIC